MFNVGGGEFLVIFLVALIVLGPSKLPEVARQIGSMMREVRRISSGFQDEMRAAMDDPVEAAARERGNKVVSTSEQPAPKTAVGYSVDESTDAAGDDDSEPAPLDPEVSDDEPVTDAPSPPISTAAAAGMYDISTSGPAAGNDETAAPEPTANDQPADPPASRTDASEPTTDAAGPPAEAVRPDANGAGDVEPEAEAT